MLFRKYDQWINIQRKDDINLNAAIQTLVIANSYIHTYIIGHHNSLLLLITENNMFLVFLIYIHTYIIHNWSLQSFSQDYNIASHYVACGNFIHEWRDSELQIFEKLFMAILLTLRVFARNLHRVCRRKNIFIFLF